MSILEDRIASLKEKYSIQTPEYVSVVVNYPPGETPFSGDTVDNTAIAYYILESFIRGVHTYLPTGEGWEICITNLITGVTSYIPSNKK